MNASHRESLVALGLTPLEATAYEHLLQRPGATGYRIAHGIGKPTANTYKALASLEEKGAVVVADQRRRLYRAVPPDELLNSLERRFMAHRRAAASGLAGLVADEDDARVYHLNTQEQILERLRAMVIGCREVALLDLCPWVVDHVAQDLAFAAQSGASVTVRVSDETYIDGVRCVVGRDTDPGVDTANAVVDVREMMLAALDPDDHAVRRALWTSHRDLVRVVHRAVAAELMFVEVENGLHDGLSTDELEDTFEAYRELRNQSPSGGASG